MRIAIVGPCAAGKSTLARNLQARGYNAEDCAQEHSGVPTMWLQIAKPDILIYLDASLATICRRLNVKWEQAYLDEMNRRLTNAREHAQVAIDTNPLSPNQVCDCAIAFLQSIGKTT